jgi:hypothetical protein
MTQEQKRIAIAKVCGITEQSCLFTIGHDRNGITATTSPNYLNDLNAMHEAEKVLLGMCDNDPQADLWISYLANLVLAAPCCLREHATAAQRAEALGLTLELWEAAK